MLSDDGIMTSINDGGSDDDNNQSANDTVVVQRHIEINEHPPVEATTMMKLLATSIENVKQIKDESNTLEEIDEKCLLGK